VLHRLRLLAFPMRTARKQLKRSSKRSPGSRPKSVRTCQGLRPRRAAQALALSRLCVLPSAKSDSVGTLNCRVLSRLDGWPAGSPVNASQRTSRCATHDSGPVWFAIPSLFGTFTFSLCRFSRRTTLYSLSISRRTSVRFFPFRAVTPIGAFDKLFNSSYFWNYSSRKRNYGSNRIVNQFDSHTHE
jgi:hypothetical protein